jgi:hypothetical protein
MQQRQVESIRTILSPTLALPGAKPNFNHANLFLESVFSSPPHSRIKDVGSQRHEIALQRIMTLRLGEALAEGAAFLYGCTVLAAAFTYSLFQREFWCDATGEEESHLRQGMERIFLCFAKAH